MKKTFILGLLTFFLILTAVNVFAVSNPLLSSSKSSYQKPVYQMPLKAGLMQKIVPIQRKLNKKLSDLTEIAKTDNRVIFLIVFISFIYGLVHALGPGHGKIIMSSFFLSKKSKLKEGILSGFIVGLTHGLAAIFLIFIIYFILNLSVLRMFNDTSKVISIVSYSILISLGVILFIKTLMKRQGEEEHHSKITSAIPISVATGLVPCPGAATVIIFSISSGAFAIGILSVLAMSLAMGIVVSGFTVAAILAQKSILQVLSEKKALQLYIFTGLRLFGSFMIIVIGTLLLLMNINL